MLWRVSEKKFPNKNMELRPLDPKHHLTPGPLPHFVAERETDCCGFFECLTKF